jgi:hypothetical protein
MQIFMTTMKYLHYAPRAEDAELVARAFRGIDKRSRPHRFPQQPPWNVLAEYAGRGMPGDRDSMVALGR